MTVVIGIDLCTTVKNVDKMEFSLSVALLEPFQTFQKVPDRNDTYYSSLPHVSLPIFVKYLEQSHHLCIQEHQMKLGHDFERLSDKFHRL